MFRFYILPLSLWFDYSPIVASHSVIEDVLAHPTSHSDVMLEYGKQGLDCTYNTRSPFNLQHLILVFVSHALHPRQRPVYSEPC